MSKYSLPCFAASISVALYNLQVDSSKVLNIVNTELGKMTISKENEITPGKVSAKKDRVDASINMGTLKLRGVLNTATRFAALNSKALELQKISPSIELNIPANSEFGLWLSQYPATKESKPAKSKTAKVKVVETPSVETPIAITQADTIPATV
jgi:hypothetical protein